MREEQILCACSAYEEKYYFNPRFASLPAQVQKELQILAVTMTSDVGGVFTMEFDDDGRLYLSAAAMESDYFFDEIGSHLKIRQIQTRYAELLEGLEKYYQAFILEEEVGQEA